MRLKIICFKPSKDHDSPTGLHIIKALRAFTILIVEEFKVKLHVRLSTAANFPSLPLLKPYDRLEISQTTSLYRATFQNFLMHTFYNKGCQSLSHTIFSHKTLKSMWNAKLSKQRFLPCHETTLIKTFSTLPHNLHISF